ncbi:hypothetical protein L1N85_20995 [Paenibacillus alkaliterrae]|nr:hypothetical protein [Paenibacillus alkaliterrae]
MFHDDQHGTAVVLLAGLYNAVKLVGKRLEDCKVELCGAGTSATRNIHERKDFIKMGKLNTVSKTLSRAMRSRISALPQAKREGTFTGIYFRIAM